MFRHQSLLWRGQVALHLLITLSLHPPGSERVALGPGPGDLGMGRAGGILSQAQVYGSTPVRRVALTGHSSVEGGQGKQLF